MATKFLNLSTDTTLGGVSPSDEIAVSQKAIKTYIDNQGGGGSGYHPDLFTWQWTDHQLNDVQWLRADTFSWQDGTVYEAGYDHLTDDISGKSLSSETISGTTVQFYLADDGHKICPASEESNVAAIYTATGVAWYYILDTVNQRFKLPRSKHEHYGNSSVIGDGKALGFTNGTIDGVLSRAGDNIGISGRTYTSSALPTTNKAGTSWGAYNVIGVNTDPTKSGLISTPTQDTEQYKYLYFYIGSFTQTAIENTAGLNAELFNNKVDLTSSWGFPTSNYTSLTLGASGTTYTATADGYFSIHIVSDNNNSYFNCEVEINNTFAYEVTLHRTSLGYNQADIIPVPKGAVMKITYDGSPFVNTFQFVYAQKTN